MKKSKSKIIIILSIVITLIISIFITTKIVSASQEDTRKTIVNNDVIYTKQLGLNNINNMLKKKFPNFNPNEYQVSITGPEENLIIDYTLKLGDFSTLSGYVIFVRNGKVVEFYDNTIEIKRNLKDINFTVGNTLEDLKEQYKKESSDKILSYAKNSINTEQTASLFYDIEKDKKYIIINTTNVIMDAKKIYTNSYEIN